MIERELKNNVMRMIIKGKSVNIADRVGNL